MIEELRDRVFLLEEKLNDTIKFMMIWNEIRRLDISALDIIARLRTYDKGSISNFDTLIEDLKERVEIEDVDEYVKKLEINTEYIIRLRPSYITQYILFLAKFWEISFEIIASYLIRKLGKELASKLVLKGNIAEIYGGEALKIWESLLK